MESCKVYLIPVIFIKFQKFAENPADRLKEEQGNEKIADAMDQIKGYSAYPISKSTVKAGLQTAVSQAHKESDQGEESAETQSEASGNKCPNNGGLVQGISIAQQKSSKQIKDKPNVKISNKPDSKAKGKSLQQNKYNYDIEGFVLQQAGIDQYQQGNQFDIGNTLEYILESEYYCA